MLSQVVTLGQEAATITGINEVDSLTRSSFAVMDSGWKYMYCKYTDRYVYIPLNGDVAERVLSLTDRMILGSHPLVSTVV